MVWEGVVSWSAVCRGLFGLARTDTVLRSCCCCCCCAATTAGMSPWACCACSPPPHPPTHPCRAVLCDRTRRHPSRSHARDQHASLTRWRAEASTLEQLRQNVLAVLTGVFERGEEVPVVVSGRLLLLLLLGAVVYVCVMVVVGLGWGRTDPGTSAS